MDKAYREYNKKLKQLGDEVDAATKAAVKTGDLKRLERAVRKYTAHVKRVQ